MPEIVQVETPGAVAYSEMRELSQEPTTVTMSSRSQLLSPRSAGAAPGGAPAGDPRLPGALLLGSLMLEDGGELTLENESTYGAVLLLPQVARSAEWPHFLTFLAIRSFIFLLLGIGVQLYMLHLLSREENVMNIFAGQVHLCNFGQELRGPSGSIATPPRTYDFPQWSLRSFARDSVKALFPHRADDIDSSMDAGEYALESFAARWVCCFVFMMSTFQELICVLRILWLLVVIPTADEPWLGNSSRDEDATWLDQVTIRIAGMPAHWKAFYLVFLVLPKFVIWKLCCQSGIAYLMETSTIEGLIVNSVALAFILNIDENLCATLMSEPVRVMMSKCEAYKLYDRKNEETMSKAEVLDRFYTKQRLHNINAKEFIRMLPGKLMASVLVTMAFVGDYYYRNCTLTEEGEIVSKPLYLPTSGDVTVWQFLLPNLFATEAESKPFWTFQAD